MMTSPIALTLVVSVPLCVGFALAASARRQSAAVRHSMIALSIVAALAVPALRVVLPSWRVIPTPSSRPVSAPAFETSADVSTTTQIVGAHAVAAGSVRLVAPALTVGMIVLSIWALGSLLAGLFVLTGLARLRWLASRARPVNDGPWRASLPSACQAAGVPDNVRLLQSDHPWLLVTWGWRRPTLFLPAAAEHWPADRIRIVLVHELAHIARRDWLWQLAAEALRAALWFNPLAWLAARRLRIESERACDDVVLETGVAADTFAGELVSLARTLNQPRLAVLPAPAMARPSSLEGRVRAMLNTANDRRPASWGTRGAIATLLLAVALPVAAIHAQAFYTLAGHLSDPTDRPLPNATVVLVNQATGALYQVQSDSQGQYQFIGLPSSAYTLDAKLAGFETLHVKDLAVNNDVQRDVRLAVGSLQESVTVSASGAPAAPVSGDLKARAAELFAQRMQKTQAACAARTSTVGGNILPPVKLVNANPIYPAAEQGNGLGGIVTMEATIGEDGLVSGVQDITGGDAALQNAAEDAVRQWQYSQTLLNCQPIPVHMKVTVAFRSAGAQ